jgi:hypothetical protein
MGACLSGPKACGLEDAATPGATLAEVKLSTGIVLDVWVLPGDTMRTVNRKVEAVHGKQPAVVVKGDLVHPVLHVKYERQWVPIQWDARVSQLPNTKLKYSDITDILKKVQLASHVRSSCCLSFFAFPSRCCGFAPDSGDASLSSPSRYRCHYCPSTAGPLGGIKGCSRRALNRNRSALPPVTTRVNQ